MTEKWSKLKDGIKSMLQACDWLCCAPVLDQRIEKDACFGGFLEQLAG